MKLALPDLFRRRTPKYLADRFGKLGPWITKFNINGQEYGGWYEAVGDARLAAFHAAFPEAETILELGCLEGGHTIGLSRLPKVKSVVALEGREQNLVRARFAESLLGNGKAQYVLCDLEKDDLSHYGRFDAVFSVGLLYHLSAPWRHLSNTRRVTENIFLWTHYIDEADANVITGDYSGRMVNEYGLSDPLSGLSQQSFWPTLESLRQMLIDAGFPKITTLEIKPDHEQGPSVTLVARS